VTRFEGQSAMAFEFAVDGFTTDEAYAIRMQDSDGTAIIDWEAMVRGILGDLSAGQPAGRIAAKAHNALVEAIVLVAARVGEHQVVLTGGCFQNRYLTERTVCRLRAAGFEPFWHRHVPPNDGGIALGQVLAAARQLE